MSGFVYILASRRMGTLYTGVTNDIVRRVQEHKSDAIKGFTSKYKVHNLVWYEYFEDMRDAISNEKKIKGWRREWKIQLIETNNPLWNDLYHELLD